MKFEYLTIQTGGMPLKQADLNELGNDGWGLVAVGFDTAYFVRELPAEYVVTSAGDVVPVDPALREIKAQTREMKRQTRAIKRSGK